MTEVRSARGRLSHLAEKAVSAGSAVFVQFVTAGGSLALQIVGARSLGAGGYGAYALIFAVLITITAVHTSWVGDSLTVYDRFERPVRGALTVSLIGTVALGVGVATTIVLAMGLTGPGGTALVGLLVTLWLANETGRRIFTVRMEFWRLAANDSANFGTALTVPAVARLTGHEITLELLLAAMCAGCLVAIALARLRLPGKEYTGLSLRGAELRTILDFAWWRSLQAGLRPSSLLTARTMIAAVASPAVLGGIEAARLLIAPALTVINGSGWFTLGRFAQAERDGSPLRTGHALRACAVLALVTATLVGAAILLADFLAPLVTGGSFDVDRVALTGWGLYAISFAGTLPLTNLATARRQSRLVFVVRGAETLCGLAAFGVLLAIGPELASYAPYCLGGGGLISATLLWLRLRREDPIPHPAHQAER